MSTDNHEYRPGAIVNGHRLSADGTAWEPITQSVEAPAVGNWFARHKVLTVVGGGAIALFALVGIAGGGDNAAEQAEDGAGAAPIEATAAAAGENAEAAAEAAEPAAPEGIGSGIHRVGVDIQPGLYVATGGGYWERLSGATGEFEDIIANGNGNGNAIVTIDSGDSFFSTSRFGEWTLVE